MTKHPEGQVVAGTNYPRVLGKLPGREQKGMSDFVGLRKEFTTERTEIKRKTSKKLRDLRGEEALSPSF